MEFLLENPLSCFREEHPCRREVDEDALCSLFLMEKDHMPCSVYLMSLRNGDLDVSVRRDAVSSISELSSSFDPFLPYLAVNYLDRFLSCRGLASTKPPWASRLLAVSCLSLAAKMLEADLPISLIRGNGGLVYDSWTVQRMETLILGDLGWRMRSVTPFSFLSFFASLFTMKDPSSRRAVRAQAVKTILKSQSDVELLRFKPSVIAASALLSASHELFPTQFQCFRTAVFACSYVNKEELMECYRAMKGGQETEGNESVIMGKDDVSDADTPMNVLDHQFWTSSRSCSTANGTSGGDTTAATNRMTIPSSSSSPSSSPKRRKISI